MLTTDQPWPKDKETVADVDEVPAEEVAVGVDMHKGVMDEGVMDEGVMDEGVDAVEA